MVTKCSTINIQKKERENTQTDFATTFSKHQHHHHTNKLEQTLTSVHHHIIISLFGPNAYVNTNVHNIVSILYSISKNRVLGDDELQFNAYCDDDNDQ